MALAFNSAYPTTIYGGNQAVTLDGKWTTKTEWIDASTSPGIPASFTFRNKYTVAFSGGLKVYEWYLIEFFGDNTNDTGDYIQICYDNNATSASAPKAGDLRIDYVGHSGNVSIKTYNGTGTGWAVANLSDVTVAQTLTTSTLYSSPHWITEVRVEKQVNSLQMVNAIRVAVYDASNPSAGVTAFPPASQQDVPSGWSQVGVGTGSFLPAVQARAFTNVAVLPGWTWYFFVQGTGGVGSLTYQWYDASGILTGQTQMLLPVTKNAPGTYTFYCNVTDSVGQTVNSNNVTMTVFT
jgi:hypothetical protein